MPDDVEFEVAAGAPLVLSSAVALPADVVRLRPGESVLMHSASGGLGAAASTPAKGCAWSARRARKRPPSKGWPHAVPAEANAAAAIRELVPSGIDVVLDSTGTLKLDMDLPVVAPAARIVLLSGNPAGGAPAPCRRWAGSSAATWACWVQHHRL